MTMQYLGKALMTSSDKDTNVMLTKGKHLVAISMCAM